ncbi:MAG: peptide chain release factor 1 [Chloroflexi bacterium]|jgi:peptide chain release factor 1|nr:MAG: peptide chain release factor 1 [Chloroflexota bacterium]
MFDRLSEMRRRIKEIDDLMSDSQIATDTHQLIVLNKERASLIPVVVTYTQYEKQLEAIEEARVIINEATDQDLIELAKDEVGVLEQKQIDLEEELRKAMLPKNPADSRDVFVEIRAGAGGDEASMFAAELYRMYSRYAQLRGWHLDLVDTHDSGVGGLKEVIFEIKGEDVYSRLKFESGAHRVQRVPTTESSGRLHTSTATVAILPKAEEVDFQIKAEDLKIDVFHSGGAGGQNVNKVATAIRITHVPTGIVAVCQDERSQLRNKDKAMNVLRARLYDKAHREHQETLSRERKIKVGTGERSEKIRTYNFPQDRITDHRINKSFHNIQSILSGNIDKIIDLINEDEQKQQLHTA